MIPPGRASIPVASGPRGGRPRNLASYVPRPDRDLVAAVRAELAAVEPARACCRRAEWVGLVTVSRGRTASMAVSRLAVRLGARLDPAVIGRPEDAFRWEDAAAHCRMAWLRGVFLACGSLSLAAGRTHLEFVLSTEEASQLTRRLAAVGLAAAWRVRRGAGVVTWKGSESVLAFLRRTGASSAAFQLEGWLVTRALRGHLNRVINAETANLARSVTSASRQLAAIERLQGEGRLTSLSPRLAAVARARAEAPDATFSELAQRVGMTRGSVQRALGRLEELADGTPARGPGRVRAR